MNNSYIITPGGMSLTIGGKPFAVDSTHPNFLQIREAIKEKRWDEVPDLIDLVKTMTKYVSTIEVGYGSIVVDGATHSVTYNGTPVHNVIVQRIFKMAEDQFDVLPMVKFLDKLMKNPSKKAIDELYGWMEHNGITITEDGYLLAHKRVRDDYKSFHDGTTDNSIGSTPTLERWQCDDRSENTCSAGLHFCSQAYLPHYSGGRGRVLLLKINPADVVAIPTDYKFAKGRACKYKVIGELNGDAREKIESAPVMTQAVVTDPVNTLNTTNSYQSGYKLGYRAGRGKQKNEYKGYVADRNNKKEDAFADGYKAGYFDGRNKNPNLY